MTVTAAICTHNGATRLPAVLRALAQQVEPGEPWEVVVVDNGSTDTTTEVAQQAWTGTVPLTVAYEPSLGVGNARKRAFSVASGEIIVFIDDDNIVDPNYLRSARDLLRDNDRVGVVGGHGTAVSADGSALPAWFHQFGRWFATAPQGPGLGQAPEGWVYGAGFAVRRSAVDLQKLTLAGRQGTGLTGSDDVELCIAVREAGWEIWYSPDMTFDHLMDPKRLNWSYLVRLAVSNGRSYPDFDLAAGTSRSQTKRVLAAGRRFVRAVRRTPRWPTRAEGQSGALDVAMEWGRLTRTLQLTISRR